MRRISFRSGLPGPRTRDRGEGHDPAGQRRTGQDAAQGRPHIAHREVLPALGEDDHRTDRLPHSGSGRPDDHRLTDPGDVAEQGLLDLRGATFTPPVLMTSSTRPVTTSRPSARTEPGRRCGTTAARPRHG